LGGKSWKHHAIYKYNIQVVMNFIETLWEGIICEKQFAIVHELLELSRSFRQNKCNVSPVKCLV
jgi:hypothetical protein